MLVFGAVRLALPALGQRVKVGLIASDQPANVDVADEGAETARLFRDYAAAAEGLAARGAQVIVLPEKLGVAVDPDTRRNRRLLPIPGRQDQLHDRRRPDPRIPAV